MAEHENPIPEPRSRTRIWTYRRLEGETIQSVILDQDNARVRISRGKAEEEDQGSWTSYATRREAEESCRRQVEDLEADGW